MKALELYRRLPRTNCGVCAPRSCMAFAVAVVKGDAALEQCPQFAAEEAEVLRAALVRGDWREELILKLGAEVRGLALAEIAPGIGAAMEGGSLRVRCFGRDFAVDADGTVRTEGPATPWIRILVLHYVRTGGNAPLAGRWVSYAELKAGLVKSSSFARECEEPLLELFRKDPAGTEAALARLGAGPGEGFPTERAWVISPLPKVPVAILFWPAEEEFPARVKVMFDATADRYLDVESLMFLAEGLVKNLERRPA